VPGHEDDGEAACRKELDQIGPVDEMDAAQRKTFDRFLDCALEATTCGEVAGCALGGIKIEAERELEGVQKGLDKMEERAKDTPPARRDDTEDASDVEALPVECRRFESVCSADESLVRRQCAEMVGNLKADPTHLAKLVVCFDAANNCYAFDNCLDEMWFELN